MQLSRWSRIGVLGGVVVTAMAARPQVSPSVHEVARIQAHFDSVLSELAVRDLSSLPVAARSRRASLLAELRRYRDAGAFPVNHDFAEATPYFVDRETGVRCAVANLLAYSGRDDIVERVRRTNNNIRVAQLAPDTAFSAWLDGHGLTLAEAARIQVPYERSTTPLGQVGDATRELTNGQNIRNAIFWMEVPVMSVGLLVSSVWNATGNADGHRRGVSQSGIFFGIATAAMGSALLAKTSMDPTAARVAIAAGVGSVALSVRSMKRHSYLASQREAGTKRAVADALVSPTVDARGQAGARVALTLKF